ncbi:ribosomal protein [Trichuris trichiura]|uniref:Ribosomal protein n=1 Tax=Trichuris trichiura TaxID=36087 RepID=A0A077ZCX4_TRITR|nr:ribosomal protein [Trichuris trichiura]
MFARLGSINWNFLPALRLPAYGSDGLFFFRVDYSPYFAARKKMRMFSQHRILKKHKNLVPCPKCGTLHQLHTICGVCYARVREQTEEIKQKLHAFNSTLSSSTGLAATQAGNEQDDFIKPTTITENRPCKSDWYSKHLKETWHRVFDRK